MIVGGPLLPVEPQRQERPLYSYSKPVKLMDKILVRGGIQTQNKQKCRWCPHLSNFLVKVAHIPKTYGLIYHCCICKAYSPFQEPNFII